MKEILHNFLEFSSCCKASKGWFQIIFVKDVLCNLNGEGKRKILSTSCGLTFLKLSKLKFTKISITICISKNLEKSFSTFISQKVRSPADHVRKSVSLSHTATYFRKSLLLSPLPSSCTSHDSFPHFLPRPNGRR